MAFNYSPKIINDSLSFYVDAANANSYVSGSASWIDISRNNTTCTLTNGPTYNSANGGSIVFDGIDDRASKTGAIDTGQNFTVNAWIYPTSLTGQRAIIGNGYPYSSRIGWLLATSSVNSNAFFLSVGGDNSYRTSVANTLTLNAWQYVTAVVTNGGGTITLYVNGINVPTNFDSVTSGTITYTNTEFYIGTRNLSTPFPFAGRIAQVSTYNRALTQQEVQQNFNATRTRFGI